VYSTCLFCQASLGTNEAIEHFQVGRRLAFDAEKGRLWVVCRKCARWNLTPIEERWEAIEECERAFSSTRMRASTDNVGLARLTEGLELVRIGRPQRPEFAAWRYGDQFGRRRRRHLIYTGLGVATAAAALITGPLVMGMAAASAFSLVNSGRMLFEAKQKHRVRARIPVPGKDRPALIRESQMGKIKVVSDGDSWHLRMPYDRGLLIDKELKREITLEGDMALRAASTILAANNHAGANRKEVQLAVDLIVRTPDVNKLFRQATRGTWRVDQGRNRWIFDEARVREAAESSLASFPSQMLLALEMATHEDIERRALEGELAMLEEAWRQAEEIAAIADDLALPAAAENDFEKLSQDGTRKTD
jgi:hypothetical protein